MKNIRPLSKEDLFKLSLVDRITLWIDLVLFGNAFVGEDENNKTERIDPAKVRIRQPIKGKTEYLMITDLQSFSNYQIFKFSN